MTDSCSSDSDTTNLEHDVCASDSDDEIPESERQQIRENLSTMSFEDLLKMKEQLGSKVYNATLFGTQNKTVKVTNVKRLNKNRPREVSSKIRLKHLKIDNPIVPTTHKNSAPRDPRFDPLCGSFDDKTFKSNYKFVNDLKEKEKKDLEKELENCTDNERKKQVKYLLQRIENQLREQKNREEKKNKEYAQKAEMKQQLKRGEKPEFKKKSVKKLEDLVDKYENLKKTNKLQKHIEKGTKKLAQNDKKRMKFEKM